MNRPTRFASLLPDRVGRAAHRLLFGWLGAGHPVPMAALDREYSSGHWSHFASPGEEPRYEVLVKLIRASSTLPPRVLDVGCGSGELARRVCGEVATYLGTDLSREGLRRAQSLGLASATFVHADFGQWRPAGEWDVIVFNEVIGYARWPARLLVDFARSLAPNGALIVSYYRAGNHAAIWRQIERRFLVRCAEEVTGGPGCIWDIKVLVPRDPS